MKKELKPEFDKNNYPLSPQESCVLRLLAPGHERYGQWLVENSEGLLGRGSVYVHLSQMEEKEFITSRLEDRPADAPGIPRRLYRIAPRGRGAYDAEVEAERSIVPGMGELKPI
jgi:DNA-binding PadR family transcriptional regulator